MGFKEALAVSLGVSVVSGGAIMGCLLLEEAEAAIIIDEPELSFGCMGCARTNELLCFMLREKDMPRLELRYPASREEGVTFVAQIKKFLDDLKKEDTA